MRIECEWKGALGIMSQAPWKSGTGFLTQLMARFRTGPLGPLARMQSDLTVIVSNLQILTGRRKEKQDNRENSLNRRMGRLGVCRGRRADETPLFDYSYGSSRGRIWIDDSGPGSADASWNPSEPAKVDATEARY